MVFTFMAKNANVAENGKSSKMEQDPYAEQRKWVGCLCKFWDDDPNDCYFAKLKEVTLGGGYIKEGGFIYEHCEPVRPDDDIIYKRKE